MGDEEHPEKCVRARKVVWDGKELDWVTPPKHDLRTYFRGVGLDYLLNDAFEKAFQKLIKEYRPPRSYDVCLIIPCSYGKPYSQSFIHYMLRTAIHDYIRSGRVHEVIVTNAGVVPRELDEYWPFCAYDWNPAYETPEIKECYVEVLRRRLKAYLKKNLNHYGKVAAYLRWDSDSWKAVKMVGEDIGINIPNLAPKSFDPEEIKEVSLEGLYQDEDLVLITPSSLRKLREGIVKIIEGAT